MPRDWLGVAVALAAFALVIGAGSWTWRLDQTLRDAGLALVEHPAHPNIVIVAIDEQSLASIGRWPWPRRVHAALLQRIAAEKPKAIGVDIAFAEPGDAEGDRQLAAAVKAAPGLVLPVIFEGARDTLPLPALAAAATLSQVGVGLDADGVLRGIDLRKASPRGSYDHMALAMLRAAKAEVVLPPGANRLTLAFAGPPGHFRRVSAATVLRGETPAGTFTGKYVLVGATATGMGDNFSTPSTVRSGPMPGVEVSANALDNLLLGRRILSAPPWAVGVISAFAGSCLLALFPLFGPRASLWATLAVASGATIAAFALLGAADFWFAPMTLVATALIAYPLWSWRRLEAASRYLDEELERLREETGPLRERRRHGAVRGDFLRRRIDAVRAAVGLLRNARRFISDSLDGLPHAALVADLDGRIAIMNRLAETLGSAPRVGQSLVEALAPLKRLDGSDWRDLIAEAFAAPSLKAEAAGADGRQFVLRFGQFRDGSGVVAGLIAVAEDVTALRQAQREREETLWFVSHDLRSPLASIIALVDLQSYDEARKPEAELTEHIKRLAWKTINLAEDFVHLTHADSKPLALSVFDFAQLAEACVLDIAPQATARRIGVTCEAPDGIIAIRADRGLVSRAVTNLLSNAVKYSGEGTQVLVSVRRREGFAVCTIRDHGVGIAEGDRARLFKHFGRIDAVTRSTGAKGIGLGLVFVETVARRHEGKVTVDSELGKGSSFSLWLAAPAGPV